MYLKFLFQKGEKMTRWWKVVREGGGIIMCM